MVFGDQPKSLSSIQARGEETNFSCRPQSPLSNQEPDGWTTPEFKRVGLHPVVISSGEEPTTWTDFGVQLRKTPRELIRTIHWHFRDAVDINEDDEILELFRECCSVKILVFAGYVPAPLGRALAAFSDLRVLDLGEAFMPELPPEWRTLSVLEVLIFGQNAEIQELPEWIGNAFPNLEELDISKLTSVTQLPSTLMQLSPRARVRLNEYFKGEICSVSCDPPANGPVIVDLSKDPIPTVNLALIGSDTGSKKALLEALCPDLDENRMKRRKVPNNGGDYCHLQGASEVRRDPWLRARLQVDDIGSNPDFESIRPLSQSLDTVYVFVLSTDICRMAYDLQAWQNWIAGDEKAIFVLPYRRNEVTNEARISHALLVLEYSSVDPNSIVFVRCDGADWDVRSFLSAVLDKSADYFFENSVWRNKQAAFHSVALMTVLSSDPLIVPASECRKKWAKAAAALFQGVQDKRVDFLSSLHDRKLILSSTVFGDSPDGPVFLRPLWVATKFEILSKRLLSPTKLQLARFLEDGLRGPDVDEDPVLRQQRALLLHFFRTIAKLPLDPTKGLPEREEFWNEDEFWSIFEENQPQPFVGILKQPAKQKEKSIIVPVNSMQI